VCAPGHTCTHTTGPEPAPLTRRETHTGRARVGDYGGCVRVAALLAHAGLVPYGAWPGDLKVSTRHPPPLFLRVSFSRSTDRHSFVIPFVIPDPKPFTLNSPPPSPSSLPTFPCASSYARAQRSERSASVLAAPPATAARSPSPPGSQRNQLIISI
jgi:hypothetical protein